MTDPKTVTILVVDDSPTTSRAIAGTLESAGYTVTEAHGGYEALAALKRGEFHLVTLDVEMPGLSGIDVLRIAKARDPELTVVMVSSLSTLRTALAALRLGAYDYVAKPFDPEDMLLSVQRALRQRTLVLENRRLLVELKGINEHLAVLVRERTQELESAHSELVVSHARLEEAYRKLQELDALKTKFIAIASHELVTPLSVVRGFVEMLATGPDNPARRGRMLPVMQECVERLVALVGEITDVALLQGKQLRFHREPTDLGRLLALVVSETEDFAVQRDQSLVLEVPEDLPPVVIDAKRIVQAVSNLVLNAIRFTQDGGRIDLGASREASRPDCVRISVRDTGIGLEATSLTRIFDGFNEVIPIDHHHSGTTQFLSCGLGLGLWVVREIVISHGGEVWAESPGLGAGSTFHILLPLEPGMVQRDN